MKKTNPSPARKKLNTYFSGVNTDNTVIHEKVIRHIRNQENAN